MWSINERFGALLKKLDVDDPGFSICRLSDDWISEILYAMIEESEAIKELDSKKPSSPFDEVF